MSAPILLTGNVGRRRYGIAGQYEIPVTVNYQLHEDDGNVVSVSHASTFVGSTFGAPVVIVTGDVSVFVSDWRQYGDVLDDEWIVRFYRATRATGRTFVRYDDGADL